MPKLSSEPWLFMAGHVGEPISFGSSHGYERRYVPILPGSRFHGRLSGTGLGGTDWQRIWPDGTTEIEAHYAARTDDGDLMEVLSKGIRSGPKDAMEALRLGQRVDPGLIYFRTMMQITSDSERLAEFTRRLFIGVGRREPTKVFMDVYAVE